MNAFTRRRRISICALVATFGDPALPADRNRVGRFPDPQLRLTLADRPDASADENLEVVEGPKRAVHGHGLIENISPCSIDEDEVPGQQIWSHKVHQLQLRGVGSIHAQTLARSALKSALASVAVH